MQTPYFPDQTASRLLQLTRDVLAGIRTRFEAIAETVRPDLLPDAAEAKVVAAELADPLAEEANSEILAELAIVAGTSCAAAGQYSTAELLLNAGLRILTKKGGDTVFKGRLERMALRYRSKRYLEVVAESEELLPLARLRADHAHLGRLLILRGGALPEEDSTSALESLDEALELIRRSDPDGARIGSCQFHRARILRNRSKWASALEASTEAIAVFERFGLVNEKAEAENQRSVIEKRMRESAGNDLYPIRELLDGERYAEALKLLEGIEVGLRSGAPSVELGRCLEFRGEALRRSGRLGEAQAVLNEAVNILSDLSNPLRLGMAFWERGILLSQAGDVQAALADLERAIDSLVGVATPIQLINCRWSRVELLHKCGHYELSLAELDTIIPELTQLAPPEKCLHARFHRGFALYRLNRTDEAVRVIEEALAEARRQKLESAITHGLSSLGGILTDTGRAQKAVPLAWEAVHRLTEEDSDEIRGNAFMLLGATMLQIGRFGEAVVAFEQAASYLVKPDAPARLVALLLTHMGQAYQQNGQHNEALQSHLQAGRLLAESGQPFESALPVMMIGTILRHAGQYQDAADAGEEAVRLLESSGRPNELASALTSLALALLELGRIDDAISRLSRALELMETNDGGMPTEYVRINLAHSLLQSGQFDAAISHFRRVDQRDLGGDALFRLHLGHGFALLSTGRGVEGLEELRKSISAYRRSRDEAGASELAMEFIGRRSQLGEAAVVFALDAGDAELAFELGQVGKGVLSQEFLRAESTLLRIDTPNVLESRRSLVELFLAQHDPGRYHSAAEHNTEILSHSYFAQCRVAELIAREQAGTPKVASLVAEPDQVLETVQRSLPPKWAILDLWHLGGDELRVFVVTRDRFRAVTIPSYDPDGQFRRRLELLVARFETPNRFPEGWHAAQADRVWDDMYSALFRPLESTLAEFEVTGLYLVPHGIWHGIPLHAARFATIENGRKTQRYLCEKYAVAYLPSAVALPHLPPPLPPTRCLSLANPDFGTAKTLPFSEWDADRLWGIFSNFGGRFFARDKATAGAADWSTANFIHFGCHGTGSPEHTGLSRLFLAGDCLLAHDVLYRRDPLMSGTTVILSGCETGIKDLRAIDEGMGLMTAFLVRGAGAVLATQWKVADHFASRVVERFARELVSGKPPITALSKALEVCRKLSAEEVASDCDALLSRFPFDRNPYEAASIQMVREAAIGEIAPEGCESIPGEPRSAGSQGAKGMLGYDDPFIWAVFQLFGRAI